MKLGAYLQKIYIDKNYNTWVKFRKEYIRLNKENYARFFKDFTNAAMTATGAKRVIGTIVIQLSDLS